jgi:UDP-GlcNAc3NAcA epimerase
VANLHREGIADDKVFLVGDVMYDAALHYGQDDRGATLERFGVRASEYVLATIHRAENTDSPARLLSIFAGLK